jgi:signal transduction histidine kinase
LVARAAVAVLVAVPAPAQVPPREVRSQGLLEYRVVQWTTADGLPQSTVNDILLLPDGTMWLATFGGLVRYDGTRFHTLDIAADEGLPSNRITALARGNGTAVWFVTQPGHLGQLHDGRARTLVSPPPSFHDIVGLAPHGTGVLAQADNGAIWRNDGKAWLRITERRLDRWGAFNSIVAATADEAWAPLGASVGRIKAGRLTDVTPLPGMVGTLAPRAAGGVWVGLETGGIVLVAPPRVERLDVRPALADRVNVVHAEGDDVLWIGGETEVVRLERQAGGWWSSRRLGLDLPGGTGVRAIEIDDSGAVWIGTGGRGLFRANRLPVRRYGLESGITSVGAVAPDGRGGAWVTSGCRGLHHVDAGGSVMRVPLEPSSSGAAADGCEHALAFDQASGSVWVRARARLYRVRREPHVAWQAPIELSAEAGLLVVNRDGSLWVASRSGRVQRVSPRGEELERFDLPPILFSAATGPDGSLWVGGDGAVFRIHRSQVRQLGAADGVPRGAVRDLLADDDGTLWIATYGGGLARLRGGRATRFTADGFLPDNALSRVLDDGRGRLWVATNRGIVVLERRALDSVDPRRVPPVVFGPSRGVPEANFGAPAGFVDTGGHAWFGTIDGLVRIDVSRFPFNQTPPLVRIERVTADDVEVAVAPEIRIPAGAERVRIWFTVPGMLYPDETRFRFRLQGVDRTWVDVGALRPATWTPAGPGRHRFVVEARNEDGVWSTAPTTVDLVVLPTWWQTTSLKVAAAVTLLIAVGAAYRLRIRGLERRHAARLRVLDEQRQMEEQAAALRSQLEHVSRVALAGELATNLAHEVNQPLGAIVNNAETGRRLLADDRRDDLDAIFGDIVSDGLRASEVIGSLRGFLRAGSAASSLVDLSSLVEEVLPLLRRELHANEIRVALSLSRSLPPVEGIRVKLQQVVVNLVMNACEALAETPGPRAIHVTTGVRDGCVEIVIEDNGPGMAPDVAARAFDAFVTTKPNGLGMGLAICRSIAESHGGTLSAERSAEGGARMVLRLPPADGGAEPTHPPSRSRSASG